MNRKGEGWVWKAKEQKREAQRERVCRSKGAVVSAGAWGEGGLTRLRLHATTA